MSGITKMFTTLASGLFSINAAADPLADGAAMPTASQRNQDDQTVRLTPDDSGYVLVYFYPKADTPGCTKQACSLRDSFATLTEKGVKVLGVSADGVKAQKAFKEKYRLPFDLLADQDGSLAKAFGVPSTLGFTKRQAFLFRDGRLVWRDLTASTSEQAADVLEFIGKNP